MRYDVAHTPPNAERTVEEFTTYKKAKRRALQVAKNGSTKVFVDTFNNDNDTVEFEWITKSTDKD